MNDKIVEEVCRVGQGEKCCRYLILRSDGWRCAKATSLRHMLDNKVKAGTMAAQGDNCPGK